MPHGDNLVYNYHNSIVACDETIDIAFKGPFRGGELYLLVDGIWKDVDMVEGYTMNISSNTPAEIEANSMEMIYKHNILPGAVASRMLVC